MIWYLVACGLTGDQIGFCTTTPVPSAEVCHVLIAEQEKLLTASIPYSVTHPTYRCVSVRPK